jgi:hypothetical protein
MKMSKHSNPFVVKCQCSLFTTEKTAQILVYDNGKHVIHEGEATDKMIKLIGNKSYFWATVVDGNISLQVNAPSNEDEFEQFDYETMNVRAK